MEQHALRAPVNTSTDADHPVGVEIVTLTRYDISAPAVLILDAYGDPTTAEALPEISEELRLTFDGAFGPMIEDSFVGAWDGGALVEAASVVRGFPWDNVLNGPSVVDLVIDLEYRRRGIVMALIAEVVSRCKDWGFDSLALRIDGHHSGAVELYDDLGFEEID